MDDEWDEYQKYTENYATRLYFFNTEIYEYFFYLLIFYQFTLRQRIKKENPTTFNKTTTYVTKTATVRWSLHH